MGANRHNEVDRLRELLDSYGWAWQPLDDDSESTLWRAADGTMRLALWDEAEGGLVVQRPVTADAAVRESTGQPPSGPDEFRRRLRGLLRDRGVTQSGFGPMIGVGPNTTNLWVRGKATPYLGTLYRMKEALGCSWEELLG